MSLATSGHNMRIRGAFEKSVLLIRRLLSDAGLYVVDEFNVSGEPNFPRGIANRPCVVLLVDTPALLFECIVLDRAAAVFIPIHVVVSGNDDTSYVHWANPMASSGLRPPAPAKIPLERLCAHITGALTRLPQAAAVNVQEQSV